MSTHRPIATAGLALLTGLSACVAPPVPAPFQPAVKTMPALTVMAVRDVTVVPPAMQDGVTKTFFLNLSRRADEGDILILTKVPNRPANVLEGVNRQNRRIDWYLTQAGGGRLAQFTTVYPETIGAAQAAGREVAIHLIGALRQPGPVGTASASLAGPDEAPNAPPQLPTRDQVSEAFPAAARTPPAQADGAVSHGPVYIARPNGAPGDGNEALQEALRTLLSAAGFPLAPTPDMAATVISGVIAITPLDDGADGLSLTWTLADPSGVEIATLAQANAVPHGYLDGAWGELAYDIALAIAGSLGEAIAGAEARKK